MFTIVMPGKLGPTNVRYANASDALQKYRQMEAAGLDNIDLRNAHGERIEHSDLERRAKSEREGSTALRLSKLRP